MTVDGVAPAPAGRVFIAEDEAYVLCEGRQTRVRLENVTVPAVEAGAGDGIIKAPMHGKILELLVTAGDKVSAGQRLAVIEAMKMEHTLRAPFSGTVTEVPVHTGAQVVEGARIMVLEPVPQS